MRRLGPLYPGAVALVHSTPWRWPESIGNEARSPAWVVALGVPIGVVAWLVAAAAHSLGLPPAIGALLGLAMLAVASAGIAERGLAERIERGGAQSPGAATIISLVFLTLVRAAAIVALPPAHWLGAFVGTAVAGRWAAIFLQALGDPIVDDDSPRSLVATPAPLWLVGAISAAVVAVGVVALGKVAIVALALVAGVAFGLGLDAQRRDRGLSAPVVATAAAAAELIVLLAATI
jgi:adenosylcobinamide-GDP ribazoletransferase